MTAKIPVHEALADYIRGKRRHMPSFGEGGPEPPPLLQLTRSYGEIAKCHPKVMKELSERERTSTTALIGALLTLPELQSNAIRLEALGHLAVMACNGPRKPKLAQISPWFDELDKGPCGRLEDPAEDVFVSVVSNEQGTYRLFEGSAEGNAFHVQIFLNVVATLPNDSSYDFLRDSVQALLKLSEAVAHRSDVPRYAVGNPVPRRSLPHMDRELTERLRSRVRFNSADLQHLGIDRRHLAPFIFDAVDIPKLKQASLGHSALENAPLLADGEEIYVVLPTTLGFALRRFVIEACIAGGMRASLERALALTYADFLKAESLLGQEHVAPIAFGSIGSSNIGTAMLTKQVDEGRYLDFLFFCDSLSEYEETSFVGMNPRKELDAFVDRAGKELKAKHIATAGYKESLLLVVGCGWGRALGLTLPPGDGQFLSEMITAHDLVTLSRKPSFDVLDLFKILRAYEAATNLGAQIVNASGLLNLVAWVDRNKGHIIPHDHIEPGSFDPAAPLRLMIPQNENLALRAKTAIAVDIHHLQDPAGRYRPTRRFSSEPAYGRSALSPYYLDLMEAYAHRMRTVYKGASGVWWVDVTRQDKLPEEASVRLGQMVLHWAEMVARHFDSQGLGEPAGLTWKVSFGDESIPSIDEAMPDDPNTMCQTTIEPRVATIRVGPGFLVSSRQPINVSERVVVRTLIATGLEMLGCSKTAQEIETLVQAVVKNDNARHFHAFSVPDLRDHVRASLPHKGQCIDQLDDAWSRLGLGWMAREREEGHTLQGIDACCDYLRKLIDKIVERMSGTLRLLNRSALVTAMLTNHETLAGESDQWRRTFGAVAALSESRERAEADAMNKLGMFSAASIASRIVLEMGLCICPEDAPAKPGQIEVGQLLADASLLFHIGGYRDAIRDGIMEATVRISPGGDVQMNHDFTDNTARPFGKSFQKGELTKAVERYSEHYQTDDEFEASKSEALSPAELEPFSRLWREEFGVSLEDARTFTTGMTTIAVNDRQGVFIIQQSRLIDRLVEITNLPAEVVKTCILQYALAPRAKWNSAPTGFLDSAWQPWRFRRQLSLVSRPIVQLDNATDPMIALAPAMAAHHIVMHVSNVLYARLDQGTFKSAGMKRYVGETTGRDGEEFNERVAERFRALGWQAKANLTDGEILARAKDPSFGDVDVLAWKPEAKRVLVIECKDLSLDKTFGEIARRLSRYRGFAPGGRRDDLRKHLDRVEVLNANLAALSTYVGFTTARAEGLFVTSREVPMQFDDGLRQQGVVFVPLAEVCKL